MKHADFSQTTWKCQYIRIFILTVWKQKNTVKKGTRAVLWFQVQHYPFWTNLAFACKTETLGSLYGHALFILTKSSKSNNQVVHEQFEPFYCNDKYFL